MEKLGLSGDTILVHDDHIIKICETNQARFIKNIHKQKVFSGSHVKSVPVIEQGLTKDGKNYVKMPRLKCENSIAWISKANLEHIDQLIDILENHFDSLLLNSEHKIFDYKSWQDKLLDLKPKINDTDLQNILFYLNSIQFTNMFYYGDYHGDFTLSNLFIYNECDSVSIDAIDFLESFIYSPINDIVKIRQDTKHLWTINLIQDFDNIDKNRAIILLNYMDKRIEKLIAKNNSISEFYLPFQILNLMRIIPYNKDQKIFNYLKSEIEELFNELNTNNALCG